MQGLKYRTFVLRHYDSTKIRARQQEICVGAECLWTLATALRCSSLGRPKSRSKEVLKIRVFPDFEGAACPWGFPPRHGHPTPRKGPVYPEFHLSPSSLFPFKTVGGTRVSGGRSPGGPGAKPRGCPEGEKSLAAGRRDFIGLRSRPLFG